MSRSRPGISLWRWAAKRRCLGAVVTVGLLTGCTALTELGGLQDGDPSSSTPAGSSASSVAATGGSGATGMGGTGVGASGGSPSASSTNGSTGGNGGVGGIGGAGAVGGTGGVGGNGCGDGVLAGIEECDDGNVASNDGCSALCAIECSGAGTSLDPISKHCYRLSTTDLNWDAAETDCVTWHGHLVSIANASEEATVVSLLSATAQGGWIGLNDKVVEGDFVWTSGEPVVFLNWSGSEPSDSDHTKNCVYHGKTFSWNDYACGVQEPYVCERWPGLP